MKLPFHIIELLKRKSGSDLRLPSDCELLSLDIESKTGVRIGATMLKRLRYTDTFADTPGRTNAYAAPEQLSGGNVDERTDIYAIGKILERLPHHQQPTTVPVKQETPSFLLRFLHPVKPGWMPQRNFTTRLSR